MSEITGSLLKTSGSAYPISLLVGEMAGKPEGGKRHIKAFVSCTVRLNHTDSNILCFRLSFRENRIPLFPDKLGFRQTLDGTASDLSGLVPRPEDKAMERHSIEIMSHENGWAITIGGITSRVLPSRRLAITEAEKLFGQTSTVFWVDDPDGVVRPYPSKRKKDLSRHISAQKETETPPKVVVMERIAVPANIHGQDMRDEHKEAQSVRKVR
ncbi:hypothetical protein [Allorhizobium terrae]|nr:hypothetical protein [Allorhizobium terrae]